MNKDDKTAIGFGIIGILGLAVGIVVGKIEEKRLTKELEEHEKEHERLVAYASDLAEATATLRSEIDSIESEVDAVLAYVEESERLYPLDEEES